MKYSHKQPFCNGKVGWPIVQNFLKWFKNVVHIENYGESDNKCGCNKIPPINNNLVENDKLISKVNLVENQIVKPTFLQSNECHSHSTSPKELILARVDK